MTWQHFEKSKLLFSWAQLKTITWHYKKYLHTHTFLRLCPKHPQSHLPLVPYLRSCLGPYKPCGNSQMCWDLFSSCCLLATHLIYTHRSTGFALPPLLGTAIPMPPAIISLFFRMLHSSWPKQPLYTCMPLQSLLSSIWVRLSDLPQLCVNLCQGELFMSLLHPSFLSTVSFNIRSFVYGEPFSMPRFKVLNGGSKWFALTLNCVCVLELSLHFVIMRARFFHKWSLQCLLWL